MNLCDKLYHKEFCILCAVFLNMPEFLVRKFGRNSLVSLLFSTLNIQQLLWRILVGNLAYSYFVRKSNPVVFLHLKHVSAGTDSFLH